MSDAQADLFQANTLPDGFSYQPEFIGIGEERQLLKELEGLAFAPFEFHGFLGKRRVISFGWRYDFNGGGLKKIGDLPAFLLPLRDAAARFEDVQPAMMQQVLLTEYPPGSTIGWHKDRS